MENQISSKRDVDKAIDIIRDAGGEIVGRTRLQKIAYLLELAGMGGGFPFEYRHYGPYSEDLALAVRNACILGLIDEEERPASWGGVYSIYRLKPSGEASGANDRAGLVQKVVHADPIELELAATAAFLSTQGYDNPWVETAKRKPDKAQGNRLEKAKDLYKALNQVSTPTALPAIS
ncbi:hypothetical protein [Ferrovibrio sp.]|uniref:hypothetical protein n=1 Tax=Ferrovibrio sp. TaxID=1917215 RepID=UPI0035126C01